MVRVDRSELTRNEIVRCAANRFLENGYTATTISSMCKSLNMSTGNLTFHYPSKEHLLAELVDMLCGYQWELMKKEAADGYSSVMAICLELVSIAVACEEDEVARDFFLSAYSSPLSIDIIRRNDKERAKEVFGEFCLDWSDEQFAEAEILVSGIEYATLMTTDETISLKTRISGALNTILTIYNVPEEIRKAKIEKALALDYRSLGKQVLVDFRKYVDYTTEQALLDLVSVKRR